MIEKSVRMPAGAAPLARYQRYYSYQSPGQGISGDYLLKGTFPELRDRTALPWDALPASVHSVLQKMGLSSKMEGAGK
jgi:hypothetical protein